MWIRSYILYPFSLNIETNVGKEIFKIIDNFPQNNILATIINISKGKLSYRTMKNMNQIITSNNAKVQANLSESHEDTIVPYCNCQMSKRSECPQPGQCHTDQYRRVESVIYRARITREDTGAIEH